MSHYLRFAIVLALAMAAWAPAAQAQSTLHPCTNAVGQPGYSPFPPSDPRNSQACFADESGGVIGGTCGPSMNTTCQQPPAPGVPGFVVDNHPNRTAGVLFEDVAAANHTTNFTVKLNTAPATGTEVVVELRNTVFNSTANQTHLRLVIQPDRLTFGPGNWSSNQTVFVTADDNSIDDDDVLTNVTLAANATATTANEYDTKTHSFAFIVRDNDLPPPPTVTVVATDGVANETGEIGSFLLSRTGSTASNLTVFFILTGTAQAGVDYTLIANGTVLNTTGNQANVTFQPGAATLNITLNPVQDTEVEGNQTASLSITGGSYTTGSPNAASIIITDAQPGPPPALPIIRAFTTDDFANETGLDNATLTLTRPSGNGTLQVNFAMSGAAAPTTDYNLAVGDVPLVLTGSTGSVTFGTGNTSVVITVIAVGDDLPEGNQVATLNIAAGTGYTVGSPSLASVLIGDRFVAPPPTNPQDSDGDGLNDTYEQQLGTDPTRPDTDGDGISDGAEVTTGTNPLDSNSPDQRVTNVTATLGTNVVNVAWRSTGPGVERFLIWRAADLNTTPLRLGAVERTAGIAYSFADTSYPGPPQTYFIQVVLGAETNLTFDAARSTASSRVLFAACEVQPLDSDGDGACDLGEEINGTDPSLADSDGDGATDGDEVAAGTDSLDSTDVPGGAAEPESQIDVDVPLTAGAVLLLAMLVVALIAITRFAKA